MSKSLRSLLALFLAGAATSALADITIGVTLVRYRPGRVAGHTGKEHHRADADDASAGRRSSTWCWMTPPIRPPPPRTRAS